LHLILVIWPFILHLESCQKTKLHETRNQNSILTTLSPALMQHLAFFFFGFYIHLFICAHIVWAIPTSCPHPLLLPLTLLAFRQNLFCPLLQFCWREDISNSKKDIVFLLVWDKDSCTERFLVLLPYTCVLQLKLAYLPDPFTTSQSPSHSDLCRFKVTILATLQWAYQTLSSFWFPIFHYSSCVCSPFSMWPVSNNITAFVLGLKSTYQGEHMVVGLLSLTNFT
jgi:hypothetical protein